MPPFNTIDARATIDRLNEMLANTIDPNEREIIQRQIIDFSTQAMNEPVRTTTGGAGGNARRGAMYIRNPGGFLHTYDGTNPVSWDEVISEEEQPVAPKRLTEEHRKRLANATRKLISEIQSAVRRGSEDLGRREAQYAELQKSEKMTRMTPREVAESERPYRIGDMSSTDLEYMASAGLCRGLSSRSDGLKKKCQQNACGIDIPIEYAFTCNGNLYCAEHVPSLEMCVRCSRLEEGCVPVTTYDNRMVFACPSCLSRVTSCTNCSERIGPEHVELALCQRCIDNPQDGAPFRNFSYSLLWTGNKKGAIMKSNRLYSSEIETIVPDSSDVHKYAMEVPKEVGISTDGSISALGGYGFETQTPRLQGAKGEELLHRMGAALKKGGATVNKSCGMHIHLDGKGIISPSRKEYPTALLQLWKTHLVFEDVIMSFLPYARRRNDYCRPMASAFKISEVDMCDSLLDAEKLWYKQTTYRDIRESKRHHYHSSRYFGVNFHSLLGHGHLEIRYHPGTTNIRKVLEWANLHALIMDAAAKKILTADFLSEATATSRLYDKTELLFEKIGLAESSRQYFRARQKKFGSKQVDESETNEI